MTKIINLPIINSESIEEVKQIFKESYLSSKIFFEGLPLVIFPEDFEHVCYESDEGGSYKTKFSKRR